MLTGVYQPTSGHIEILGEKVIGLKPYELTKKHIARTFQNIRLFKQMSVIDNVKISFNYKEKYNLLHSIFRLPKYYKEEKLMIEKAKELLEVFGFLEKENELAMNLISWIRDKFKISILLIEHDMKLVMGICERLIVLDHGQILATGKPEEIKKNPKVISAYLGEEVAI